MRMMQDSAAASGGGRSMRAGHSFHGHFGKMCKQDPCGLFAHSMAEVAYLRRILFTLG